HPEKAALGEPRAQRLDFAVFEFERADVLHVELGTLEEGVIGETDDDEIRRTPRIERDARPGEFSQSDGKVQLGVWVVRRPALTARFAVHLPAVHAAAEIEAVSE